MQLNERLLVKTQAAQVIVDAWAKKQKQAPQWWPDQGEPDHQERLRAVEKILLEEEAHHGRQRPLTPPHGRIRDHSHSHNSHSHSHSHSRSRSHSHNSSIASIPSQYTQKS